MESYIDNFDSLLEGLDAAVVDADFHLLDSHAPITAHTLSTVHPSAAHRMSPALSMHTPFDPRPPSIAPTGLTPGSLADDLLLPRDGGAGASVDPAVLGAAGAQARAAGDANDDSDSSDDGGAAGSDPARRRKRRRGPGAAPEGAAGEHGTREQQCVAAQPAGAALA